MPRCGFSRSSCFRSNFFTLSLINVAECIVELELECVSNNGIQCDEIFPEAVICEQRPTVLTMLYNGGPCGQSFNIQPSTLFQCFDLINAPGAGPPPLEGPAYIEARASKSGELFFAGVVEAGSEFNITSADGGRIEADTSILIRQGTDNTGAPMQLINYHTSCSRNLFLKDRYGSTQVAGWINEEQGEVDCTTEVIYNYDIQNTGSVDATLCSLMTTITPPGVTLDLTENIADQVVGPGMNFTIGIPTEIDLTTRTTYTVEATLVGKNPVGKECTDMDTLQFEAGTPVFGLPPTPAPPTASPAPTPDPAGQSCMIEASAACVLGNLAPCSLITSLPPAFYTCQFDAIIDLGFIFTGGTCAESTTTQVGFVCTDSAPIAGPARIRAVGTTSGDEYFNGLVTPDSPFAIQGINNQPIDAVVDITVANLDGTVLQSMTLNTECNEQNDLTLGKTFGSFTFGNYRNEDAFVQGFQEASWAYVAKNTGTIDVDITEYVATTNGVPSGPDTFPIVLAPDEELPFTVPQLLSLIEPGVTYTGALDTTGIPGPCTASDSESVTIDLL
jgi:hypothetical protein